ncbi:MAG: hypothetical protein V4787_07505 [Pseudomonadota bacterium]
MDSGATAGQSVQPMRAQGSGGAVPLGVVDSAEVLMDLAEVRYYPLFPAHIASQSFGAFRFRYYESTGHLLGVVVEQGSEYPVGSVYVMGGGFGNSPVLVGPMSAFANPVDASATGDDNGCYDLAAYDGSGKHVVLTRTYSTGSTSTTSTQTIDSSWGGFTSFQGRQVQAVTRKTTNQGSTDTSTVVSYSAHTAPGELTSYGFTTDTKSTSFGTTTNYHSEATYTPPFPDHLYGLGIGQSVVESDSYTGTTVQTRFGTPPITTTSQISFPRINTYLGRETITVPAGTYETCKFETINSTSAAANAGINMSWIAVGTGISVKQTANFPVSRTSSTYLATSITVDGKPF